jgi:universal stress protein A
MTDGKILVPIDGSKNSEKGLRYACSLASKIGANITVLYVVNVPYTGQSAIVNVRSLIAAGGKILAGARKVAEEENCTRAHYYLRQGIGNPAHEIVKLAKEKGFSLIVMSATGHTALSHLLMGSVSDVVVHNAPCAVLIVR